MQSVAEVEVERLESPSNASKALIMRKEVARILETEEWKAVSLAVG
jgi:hypothetical protein